MPAAAKACPIVLREICGRTEILVFRHPLAGVQLVKGTIEDGERPEQAALRELAEESGIYDAIAARSLGTADLNAHGQVWWLVLCEARALTETWTHRTTDDGGRTFSFFWHPLDEAPGDDWHPMFAAALRIIRDRIA